MTTQDILDKYVYPYPNSLQGGLTFREHAAIEGMKARICYAGILTEDSAKVVVNAASILAAELARTAK